LRATAFAKEPQDLGGEAKDVARKRAPTGARRVDQAALRLGFSMVPVHFGEPQRQAQIFFRRAVCGMSSVMP
jgi:hypothetical protein